MSARSVTIVASELLGRPGTGGAGTADSLLAVALGRHGHRVRLVIASGRAIGPLNPEWRARYEATGVEISVLEPLAGVRPSYLAPALEVFHTLRERPPDVVIADDWRGLAFTALRARQTGTALIKTAFIAHCHGPGRVLTEFAQKVPDTVERFGEDVMERASIELADAVVSPSEWLLGWMRAHGWAVRDNARVVQYVRQAAALDEPAQPARVGVPIRRLAFFGQLREGKGIRIFVEALALLPPETLEGIDVLFLGSGRGRWASERIAEALPPAVQQAHFETRRAREAALAELRTPGTLAVMPSLLDNSPNTVAECIEQGIPFISTSTGGIPELVAEDDRERVLCPPNTRALAAALERALRSTDGVAPARPAREAHESVDAWLRLVAEVTPAPQVAHRRPNHVAVVVRTDESARRARRLADATSTTEVEVVVADSRRAGFDRTAADWIVFLDDDDQPDDGLLDAFVAAQAAADADVVTAAVRPAGDPGGVQLFLGDPGPLGMLENQYGVLGFLRSDAVAAQPLLDDVPDPDWPLFARVALAGGRIVSLPDTLSTHRGKPGRIGDVPGAGVVVLEAFEERPTRELRALPQFAATLSAALARTPSATAAGAAPPLAHRLRRRAAGLVRARRPS